MAARRYSIVVADRRTGVVRRVTLSLRPTLAVVTTILALPILIGLGARWSAKAAIADLQTTNAALRVENANYRQATGQLSDQIAALQTTVDDIGQRAVVDPDAGRAMEKLPAVVKSRAMGGAPAVALGSMLGETGPEAALGVLHDLLGVIGSRLESVRTGVTNNASSVPRSHSRAITSAVRSAPISVMIKTIKPGTRK